HSLSIVSNNQRLLWTVTCVIHLYYMPNERLNKMNQAIILNTKSIRDIINKLDLILSRSLK
ncbi:hypothetical protein ACU40U_16550, partial [Staphylococcus arlettae]